MQLDIRSLVFSDWTLRQILICILTTKFGTKASENLTLVYCYAELTENGRMMNQLVRSRPSGIRYLKQAYIMEPMNCCSIHTLSD